MAFPRTKMLMPGACLVLSANLFADTQAIELSGLPPSTGPILLKVTQKPLPLALEGIAKQAGIILHYSGLPKTPVSAHCVDVDIKQILECLLDKKADLMFRYAQAPSVVGQNQLEEVWVLGVGKDPVQGTVDGLNKPKLFGHVSTKPVVNAEEIGVLLVQAQSKNTQERANALAALALKPKETPRVRNVLIAALSDQDAEVRGQAVFALAKYKDAGVESLLELALQDDDVSVRLMVVDSAENHPGLWKLALNDSDATIRVAASIKLSTMASQVKN